MLLLAVACGATVGCVGSTPLPSVTPDLIQATATTISSGDYHTCALLPDGSPVCWGMNKHGQAPRRFTSPVKLTAVTSGGAHSCGLASDGSWACWGAYVDPRFSLTQRYGPIHFFPTYITPSRVEPPIDDDRFTAVSGGRGHICALRPTSEAVCWGDNNFGQASPFENERFKAISSGDYHTCALRFDGSPVCWSENEWAEYRLTDEDIEEMTTFVPCPDDPSEGVYWKGQGRPPDELLSWPNFICGRDWYACGPSTQPYGESFSCWDEDGDRIREDMRDRTLVIQCPPIDREQGPRCSHRNGAEQSHAWDKSGMAPPGLRLRTVSSGGNHSCGLREDGSPVCWGNIQIGEPLENQAYEVVSIRGSYACKLIEGRSADKGDIDVCRGFEALMDERFAAISSGREHTCALRLDGSPVCWGFLRGIPPEGERFVAISSGREHTCVLRVDGSPVCWGSNSHGQASPPDMRFATGSVQSQ